MLMVHREEDYEHAPSDLLCVLVCKVKTFWHPAWWDSCFLCNCR